MPYDVQKNPSFLGTLMGIAGAGAKGYEQAVQMKEQQQKDEEAKAEFAQQMALQQQQFGLEQRKQRQEELLGPGALTLQQLQIKQQQDLATPLDLKKAPKELQSGQPPLGASIPDTYKWLQRYANWLGTQPGAEARDQLKNNIMPQIRTMEQLYGKQIGVAGQIDVAKIRAQAEKDAASIRAAGSVQAAGIRAARLVGLSQVPFSGADLQLWQKAATAMAQKGVNPNAIAVSFAGQTSNRALQNKLMQLGQTLTTQQTTPQGRLLNPTGIPNQ